MRIIWLQCISVTPVKERWQIQVTDVTYRTHQAVVDELMAMKADCGVGSPRQPLDPKLPWHTKLTLDTRRPNSTSVLRLSRALVRQLNRQSEWSDGPPDRWAQMPKSACQISRKKPDEYQLQPMVQNTPRKLSRPTNKNCPTANYRLCVFWGFET